MRILVLFLIFILTPILNAQEPIILNNYIDARTAMRKYNAPGIFVFTARWCGACTKMKEETWKPLIPDIKSSYIVYFVDIDKEPEIYDAWVEQGKLSSLPAYAVTNKGASQILLYDEGFRDKEGFVTWINEGIRDLKAPQPKPGGG